MLKERTFNTGEVTINYAEGPSSGPPMLLLHGGGDRWQDFLPIIPSLVMRWHLFALDLRGHGLSGRLAGHYRPEHYVADISAFLENQFSQRVVLFGHSLGGWIALKVAAQESEQVRALILGDPPLNIDRFLETEGSQERIEQWRALIELAALELDVPELASKLADLQVAVSERGQPVRYKDLPGIDAAHLRAWAKSLRQVDPDVAQYHASGRLNQYVENLALESALRRTFCPVLLLQADPSTGGMNMDEDVQDTLSLLQDGVLVKLDGVGHGLGLDSWNCAPLLRAVTSFLESL